MSQWFEGALARAEAVNDWLSPVRAESLVALKKTPWPTRKTEAWKYTPVRPLERAAFAFGDAAVPNDPAHLQVDHIEGLNSIDLVFVNGQLMSSLGDTDVPSGLTIQGLGDVDDFSKGWAAQLFSDVKPKRHLFGLVNDVLATEGLVIDVAPEAVIDKPIRLVHLMTEGAEGHSRVLVRLGAKAKATVIEQHSGESVSSFNTAVTEYQIGEQAELEHYRFALQTGEAMTVGGSHFTLMADSQINSTLVGFGSNLSRLDVDVNHAGEKAHAKMNAIYLLKDKEIFDLHSTIEHAVPNCTTDETVRGIVGDEAKAVFNGRIHIHRDAQKTLAELSNKNLLLSRKAQINTKPELEIYADDVRCAHGATVAELDKKALYYMQSRGVSRAQALVMLNFGFINALVDEMPNEALAEWLRPQLKARFATMEVE